MGVLLMIFSCIGVSILFFWLPLVLTIKAVIG